MNRTTTAENGGSSIDQEVLSTSDDDDSSLEHVEPIEFAGDESLERWDSDAPPHTPFSGGVSLPCVIPQTTKSINGVFFSPFVRAYVPELAAHGIREADFVTFVDGLNEAFIAHPMFQGLGIVGGVMSVYYGIPPVQWAGAGLQAASGVASAATSYLRTRAYIKAVNQDLFHPSGLHLNIMTTKNMMKKVDYPEDKLQLPPLEFSSDLDQNIRSDAQSTAEAPGTGLPAQADPRMRRVRALEGYVMPIDLDVPAAVAPDSLFRRMGAARAARQMRNQEREMTKQRTKGQTKDQKKSRRAAKKQRKGEERIEGMVRELASNKAAFEKKMTETQNNPKEQSKALRTFEKKENKLNSKLAKEMAKLDSKVDKRLEKAEAGRSKGDPKEARIAHKVRWIVISPGNGGEGSDEDSLPSSESDVDAER
ncbi:hypothetical protein LTS15_001903 [Exophiala xenobiotica]|nr:hypothetical protein LTS15_001903 [Exophiala xenobiotica]